MGCFPQLIIDSKRLAQFKRISPVNKKIKLNSL